jgi:hypothetical protein
MARARWLEQAGGSFSRSGTCSMPPDHAAVGYVCLELVAWMSAAPADGVR